MVNTEGNAAQGCFITGNTAAQGNVTAKDGLYDQNWTFSVTNTVYLDCPLPLSASNLHVENYSQVYVNTICIPFLGCATTAARCRTTGSGSYTGYVYAFDVTPCPLDGYSWILFFSVATLSLYKILQPKFTLLKLRID